MPTTQSLSPDQARKITLLAQGVLTPPRTGTALEATRQSIQRLGYVQIDTISVIARAHLHTLWNRNPRFKPAMLDRLVDSREVFEYWSHAAAYLPMEDYRYCLPRMHQERSSHGHWHTKNLKIMTEVRRRIEDEGPLMARDFEDPAPGRKAMWDRKPAKQALEQLFMEGDLMAVRRDRFHKVYDLAERVLPASIDQSMPTEEEYCRYLVKRYLGSHGLGRVPEFSHLRKGWGAKVKAVTAQMLEQGELETVQVRDQQWVMEPDAPTLLAKSLPRSRLRLLSPFDNLVIQRKRVRELFDFDYQIECYLPEQKRRYGYFVLPVLWRGNLVARVDLKAHRSDNILEVRNLVPEPKLVKLSEFIEALGKELEAFAGFNHCTTVSIGRNVDGAIARQLNAMWRN